MNRLLAWMDRPWDGTPTWQKASFWVVVAILTLAVGAARYNFDVCYVNWLVGR